MSSPETSVSGSAQGAELSFSDSDFFLNLDDVDIGPQIGQGAFSKVYLGRYLGELVAVKKQARNEADLEAYLMRELAVLKHYQHENLLQYVGASNATASEPGGNSHVFIVTELACGGDLLALLLSEGEVGWKLRVSILTDAARALEFLHRKSLIHRDIKSPNILLDSNHRCKIADFGMARQLGTNMTVVGTDAYMAPELMFDNPYGTSADMFSFGIVLWETIYRQKAGEDDFIERRMSDRFELDVQGLQDDSPPDTSPSLVALARELVESDPDNRPTAEDTLLWLEDMSDLLREDDHPPSPPIDYERLFPISMGEQASQRRRSAEVKGLSASAIARAEAGVVTIVSDKSASSVRSPHASPNASPSTSLRARESSSPLPPGVPKDNNFLARRSTMGTGAEKNRNSYGVKRSMSLQRYTRDGLAAHSFMTAPAGALGSRHHHPDTGAGAIILPQSASSTPSTVFSDSVHTSASTHTLPVDPSYCKHILFGGCMQGGFKHGREGGGGSSSGGAGGGGGGSGDGVGGSGGDASGSRVAGMGGVRAYNSTGGSGLSPLSSADLGVTGGGGGGVGVVTFGSTGGSGGALRTGLSPASSFIHKAIGATHAPITRQGYLYKKGKSGLKNWQKRWFVLEGSKMIWYKDSKSYPREPRGYLELKGCFLVKGQYLRWKILSADASAEQDDYNRAFSAKEKGDMEGWLKSLQEAIDSADTGEGPDGVILPVLHGDEGDVDETLFYGTKGGYRTEVSVEAWLESLGLGNLSEAFFTAGYTDCLMIQEMGLTDEDLAYIGVRNAAQRKALKMGASGFVELLLQVEISAFFNFHSELVYRLDSRWRYLRATTYFEFSDFEDLHRRLKAAMKETKFHKMMPSLPQRPADPRGRRLGSIDHARQMANVQQELNRYTQKLVMLVGTKEPYFTVLCGMLDLLPPDPNRLPMKSDEFLSQMQSRLVAPGIVTLGGRRGRRPSLRGGGGGGTEEGSTAGRQSNSAVGIGTALLPTAKPTPLVMMRGGSASSIIIGGGSGTVRGLGGLGGTGGGRGAVGTGARTSDVNSLAAAGSKVLGSRLGSSTRSPMGSTSSSIRSSSMSELLKKSSGYSSSTPAAAVAAVVAVIGRSGSSSSNNSRRSATSTTVTPTMAPGSSLGEKKSTPRASSSSLSSSQNRPPLGSSISTAFATQPAPMAAGGGRGSRGGGSNASTPPAPAAASS